MMNKLEEPQCIEKRPTYHPPLITTFTAEELLEIVGPVQAGASDQGDMGPMGSTGAYEIHKLLNVL